MSDSVVTKKGTVLPLLNLKGKKYLMGAYRLQWMNEEVAKFDIQTEFLLLNDEQTIARATVILFDENGHVLKKATATKRETKRDFPDHTEKSESSAIFRALAMMGYGTQYALSDLDEGNRLADSPLETSKREAKPDPRKTEAEKSMEAAPGVPEVSTKSEGSPSKPSSSFRKPKAKVEVTPEAESEWS